MRLLGNSLQEELAKAHRELDSQRLRVSQVEAELDAKAAQEQALDQEADRGVQQFAIVLGVAGEDVEMDGVGNQSGPGMENSPWDAGKMTIQEIKKWLLDRDHEGEVWELANRKAPRVKKDDWVQLMRSKQ
jgi:hypothetical protein